MVQATHLPHSSPRSTTPVVTAMRVIPVAGHDSMLLNLCGAHAPYFTRWTYAPEAQPGTLSVL